MRHFDLSREEVASFDGKFYRFTEIEGPIRLVRFSDSGRGERGKFGRFWLYGSEVAEILQAGPDGFRLVKEISQRWAICDDWGDKQLAWVMNVPPRQAVPAIWGRAKAQPKVSVKGQEAGGRQTVRSYAGGSLQLIVPVTDENGAIDLQLASLIRGPESTLKIASAPNRFLT